MQLDQIGILRQLEVQQIKFITTALLLIALNGCAIGNLFKPYQTDFGTAKKPETTKRYNAPKNLWFKQVKFSQLPDYKHDHPENILVGLLASCSRYRLMKAENNIGTASLPILAKDWQETCRVLEQSLAKSGKLDRELFEKLFVPYLVNNNKKEQGLFTGYYEAELEASRKQSSVYRFPLYKRPSDLLKSSDGKGFKAYHTRGAIDKGALKGKGLELFWAKDALDVFILQIQGSGQLKLDDGSIVRIGYDGHNGYRYRSVAKKMIADGFITSAQSSWPGIRNWLENNPNKAQEVLSYNQRYVFFRLSEHQRSIVGAHETPLIAGRSLAVDQRYIPLGSVLWVDIKNVPDAGPARIRRFMLAQDTGGAIKGIIRGDFFWGSGDNALHYAGRMKNEGSYYILLPIFAVKRFGNIPTIR